MMIRAQAKAVAECLCVAIACAWRSRHGRINPDSFQVVVVRACRGCREDWSAAGIFVCSFKGGCSLLNYQL